jgi:hypothetical protein
MRKKIRQSPFKNKTSWLRFVGTGNSCIVFLKTKNKNQKPNISRYLLRRMPSNGKELRNKDDLLNRICLQECYE